MPKDIANIKVFMPGQFRYDHKLLGEGAYGRIRKCMFIKSSDRHSFEDDNSTDCSDKSDEKVLEQTSDVLQRIMNNCLKENVG